MDPKSKEKAFAKLLSGFKNIDDVYEKPPSTAEHMISHLAIAMCDLIEAHRHEITMTPDIQPPYTDEDLSILSSKLRDFEQCMHSYFLMAHIGTPLGKTTIIPTETIRKVKALIRDYDLCHQNLKECREAFEKDIRGNFFIRHDLSEFFPT
jgi:hypothetical protein